MPLEKGSSREVVSRNISEMVKHGHPQKQAVAASLRNAREGDNGTVVGCDESALDASIQNVGPAAMTAAEINKKADSYWKQWRGSDDAKVRDPSDCATDAKNETRSIGQIFSAAQINKAQQMYAKDKTNFASRFASEVAKPGLQEINKRTGQENDPRYLGYLMEYALGRTSPK